MNRCMFGRGYQCRNYPSLHSLVVGIICICAAYGFSVDDVALTAPGTLFTDPEFNDEEHRVTYWDYSEAGNIKVFVGEIDPQSGLFRDPPGRDHLIAERVSPFFKNGVWWAHNGPEWGCDKNGWAVFFTKEDGAGTRQLWQANWKGGRYDVRQCTDRAGGACGGLYSQYPDDDLRLMFYIPDRDTVVYAPVSSPNTVEDLPGFGTYKSISHWVPGKPWITYVRAMGTPPQPQLVYLDTRTGTVHQVSDEAGDKYDAWGFRAFEYGGELLMMCVVGRKEITVYRDTTKNGKPWTRIASLSLPKDSPHRALYSVEPIAPCSGVNGISWFSLNASPESSGRNLGATGRSAKDGSIWVLGLGSTPMERIARRVDEGMLSGIATSRYEAECMLGKDEVFIYYERRSPQTGRGEIRRCRTGIRVR